MKIYTVLYNSYDYYQFTDWVMTTVSIDEVTNYIDGVIKTNNEIRNNVPHWKETPVFFIEDVGEVNAHDGDCSAKEQSHIVVIVKDIQ